MEMIEVIEIKKTCDWCPSQWEGKTKDNRWVYIRYRWSYLSVALSEVGGKDVYSAIDAGEIFGISLDSGDGQVGWQGGLTYDQLKEATKDVLILPAIDEKDDENKKGELNG